MYNFFLMAHSGWRWLVLILVVIATIKMLVGWLGKQPWRNLDGTLIRVTHIVVAVQVALGIILYILFLMNGAPGYSSIGAFTGSHVVPALLAYGGVLFATLRSKRGSDTDKFKFAFIGLIIAIIMIYGALATVGGIFVQR
jgi:hypothetical protein